MQILKWIKTVWDLGILQQAFVWLCIPRWLDQLPWPLLLDRPWSWRHPFRVWLSDGLSEWTDRNRHVSNSPQALWRRKVFKALRGGAMGLCSIDPCLCCMSVRFWYPHKRGINKWIISEKFSFLFRIKKSLEIMDNLKPRCGTMASGGV